jgi:eukaryotic translation initiation factor 2C
VNQLAYLSMTQQLRAAGAACFEQKKVGPTLFVVILPEGGNDIYTMVKKYVVRNLWVFFLTAGDFF